MTDDDDVCLCFHVTRGKLEKFVRLYRPAVPSRLSECGGAGTGCGWCVPILRKIWETGTADGVAEADDYAAARQAYIETGERPT